MECDICGPDFRPGLDFQCAGCARSSVYLRRLEQARVLMEQEKLSQTIEAILSNRKRDKTSLDEENNTAHLHEVWNNEVINVEIASAKLRLEIAKGRMSTIKQEMSILREQLSKRGDQVVNRRQSITAIQQTLPERQEKVIVTTSDGIIRSTGTLEMLNRNSTIDKAKLCRETAILMRLKQKRRQKDGMLFDTYSIAGLPLPDLRDINNMKCAELTAMLGSVAHLVMLVSFYLGIRLPAEITVPYRDYPLPTINTPSASYSGKKVDFPGSGSIPSISSSPSGSRLDSKGTFRPRPLFIGSDDRDERLAQIAKKDSQAFNFFVEGISLLAWDIAWLCRSQGFTLGTNKWEDICNVGRNLYQLILAPPPNIALSRINSDRNTKDRKQSNGLTQSPRGENNPEASGKLGHFSHLGAFTHLGDAQSMENFRGWSFSKYNTIADSLRRTLLNEMTNAEWELLQEQEWDDGGEQFDEAVIIKPRTMNGQGYDDARSIMTMQTHNEEAANHLPGTRGWTKLKSRERA